jgi:hypothetical protein
MMTRIRLGRTLAAVLLLAGILRAADTTKPTEIDSQKSVMTVRGFKSGMFSAFGHERQISAPIQQGRFSVEQWNS